MSASNKKAGAFYFVYAGRVRPLNEKEVGTSLLRRRGFVYGLSGLCVVWCQCEWIYWFNVRR